ncbi:response regulator transcription factor [Ktedonosporobacter rubrisoli]|nr:LuxR C-terminal-related transcriptional regulator [Ktedonosporobacter rubrisoli]
MREERNINQEGRDQRLTEQELAARDETILNYLRQGWTNQQIAEVLHIRPEQLRRIIYRRLFVTYDVHTRAELVETVPLEQEEERDLAEYWTASYDFSYQECRIATLLYQGLNRREIAEELCVAESTVRNHLHRVYQKLGACHRARALYVLDSAVKSLQQKI